MEVQSTFWRQAKMILTLKKLKTKLLEEITVDEDSDTKVP